MRRSPTNPRSLKTPPVSPVVTSPADGFAHGYHHNSGKHHRGTPGIRFQTMLTDTQNPAASQLPKADRNQFAFQEVDLGERRTRDHRNSADKENIPPPISNHGLKRLGIPSGANESAVSVARTPKVSAMRRFCIVSWALTYLVRRTVPRRPHCLLARDHLHQRPRSLL